MTFPRDPKHPKNQELVQHVLREHAPLINKEIIKLKNSEHFPKGVVDDDDLHFAAFHGLMDAFSKYDHAKSISTARPLSGGENDFTRYAAGRIKWKMMDHIKSYDQVSNVLRNKAKSLKTDKP